MTLKNQIILSPSKPLYYFCSRFQLELLSTNYHPQVSFNVNDNFGDIQMKLYEIIVKKSDVSPFDGPFIKLYASWRTRSSIQHSKKPLHISKYIDLNDESDYEGIIQDIQAANNSLKMDLDKIILCILAIVTVDEIKEPEDNSFMLEMSLPKQKVEYNAEYCWS